MDTLDHKLRAVIAELTTSARTSKIISINAALIAEQLQQGRSQNMAALKVVATEIQRLSDESAHGIAALHAILADVKLLTHTINLAGRQRMLSQKIMKLFLLQRSGSVVDTPLGFRPLVEEFEANLERLSACPLNTPEIRVQLQRGAEVWGAFMDALDKANISSAAALNERVLQEMHAAVQAYEALAGTTPASAPASRANPSAPPRSVTHNESSRESPLRSPKALSAKPQSPAPRSAAAFVEA
jgi:hypothetical protein